uniref:Uncharacterized protein n=1 Tax=Graphocephala atropunctata TaxID=36148 RepID=A0A1B6MFH9_9HEMI
MMETRSTVGRNTVKKYNPVPCVTIDSDDDVVEISGNTLCMPIEEDTLVQKLLLFRKLQSSGKKIPLAFGHFYKMAKEYCFEVKNSIVISAYKDLLALQEERTTNDITVCEAPPSGEAASNLSSTVESQEDDSDIEITFHREPRISTAMKPENQEYSDTWSSDVLDIVDLTEDIGKDTEVIHAARGVLVTTANANNKKNQCKTRSSASPACDKSQHKRISSHKTRSHTGNKANINRKKRKSSDKTDHSYSEQDKLLLNSFEYKRFISEQKKLIHVEKQELARKQRQILYNRLVDMIIPKYFNKNPNLDKNFTPS